MTTADEYYNLGASHQSKGEVGLAVAYLEKAKQLDPSAPDILTNLAIARAQLAKRIGEGRLDAAATPLESTISALPILEIQGALGILSLALALIWARSSSRSRDWWRALKRGPAVAAAACIAASLLLGGAEAVLARTPAAVSLQSTSVRSGPGERFLELSRLEPGMKVRVTGENLEAWHQIRFSESGLGWVPASSLLLLR